jgi:hypothetical protein
MFGSKSLTSAALEKRSEETELLLGEANAASASARGAWIFLIALEAYFFIALAGISHRDLLLNTPVAQPILQVSIPLRSFILFGPIVLIAMHAGVLQQHIILARKLKALDAGFASLEFPALSHAGRLRLHTYYFTQYLAGPETSRVLRAVFVAMDWLFLRLLPVGLLLAFQITYLPSHDTDITWWHRVYVLAGLTVVATSTILLARLDGVYAAAKPISPWTAVRAFAAWFTAAAVAVFSFAVATIPGEWIDRMLGSIEAVSAQVPYQGLGNVSRTLPP